MRFSVLLLLAAAGPALADSEFRIRHKTRDDLPPGKGRCEIRLQVYNEVEVSVRGEMLSIRTISGQGARDDGSECNAPLPGGTVEGFHFEVKERRNEIRLVAEPSPLNGGAAIVRIRDTSAGFGRYHFRLSWNMTGPERRPEEGFSWNNNLSYKGNGHGESATNDSAPIRLGEANIAIDRAGRITAWFRIGGHDRLTFNGSVVAQETGRWKADIASEDHRLRGPMYFSIDERGNVNTVTIEATDGRDRLRLSWDRR